MGPRLRTNEVSIMILFILWYCIVFCNLGKTVKSLIKTHPNVGRPLEITHVGRKIRHKHVTCGMRNSEWHLRVNEHCLRSHTARMKHGNFIRSHFDRVTPVGFIEIVNAQDITTTNTNGASMGMRVLRCNLNFLGNLHGRDWLHGYDHVALE